MSMNYIRDLIIGSTFVLTQLSGSMYIPAMPTLAKYFQVDGALIGLTLSIFFSGYAIGQIAWGTASDYWGRKRILLLSLALYLCVAVLITFAFNYIYYVVMIALLGFVAAAYTSIGNALLKDIHGKNLGRAISYVGIAMAVAPTVSPIVGVYLLKFFSWQAIYVFLACYGALCFLGTLWLIPETPRQFHHADNNQKLTKTISDIMQHPEFLGYIFPLGLLFGLFFSYLGLAPYIYINYLGYSVTALAYILLVTTATYVIGTIYTSIMIKKKHPARIVFEGAVLALAGAFLTFIVVCFDVHSLAVLLVTFAILMLGTGMVIPSAKAGAMQIFKKSSGTTSSMMKFTQTICCVAITAIASALHSPRTILPAVSLFLCVTIIALLLTLFLHGTNISKRIFSSVSVDGNHNKTTHT